MPRLIGRELGRTETPNLHIEVLSLFFSCVCFHIESRQDAIYTNGGYGSRL